MRVVRYIVALLVIGVCRGKPNTADLLSLGEIKGNMSKLQTKYSIQTLKWVIPLLSTHPTTTSDGNILPLDDRPNQLSVSVTSSTLYEVIDKAITSILKISKYIITSIKSSPVGLAALLPIISISTFKTDVTLYMSIYDYHTI
jgi:hypothetical protein